MTEIRSDEHLTFARGLSLAIQVVFDAREAIEEEFFDAIVAVMEFAQNLPQLSHDFIFRESHDAGDDSLRDVFAAGQERSHQHPRTVRDESWTDSFHKDGGAGSGAFGFLFQWVVLPMLFARWFLESGERIWPRLHFRQGQCGLRARFARCFPVSLTQAIYARQ